MEGNGEMRLEEISRDWFTFFSGKYKIIFCYFMQGVHAIPFTVLGKICTMAIV